MKPKDDEIVSKISYTIFRKFQAVKKALEPQDITNKSIVKMMQVLYKSSGDCNDELYDIINSVRKDYLCKLETNNQSLPANEFMSLFVELNDIDKLKTYIYYQLYSKKNNMIDNAINNELIKNIPQDDRWYDNSEFDEEYDQLPLKDELQKLLVQPNIINDRQAYLLSKQIYALQLEYREKYESSARDTNAMEYKKKFEDSIKFLTTHLEKTGRKVAASNIQNIKYFPTTNKKSIKKEWTLELELTILNELSDLINTKDDSYGLGPHAKDVTIKKIPSIAKELSKKLSFNSRT